MKGIEYVHMVAIYCYVWLLLISIGFSILFHYFDKNRMPKKAIVPSVLILFVLLAVSNYIKGAFFYYSLFFNLLMILFEKGNTTFNSTRVGVVVALVEGIRTREDSVMWITGTVPSSGTKEVLLYLSKDPDDWGDSKPLLLHSNQIGHILLAKEMMTRMIQYIMLLFIAVGVVLLTHYFDKEKMPKKSIVPASALMFVLLIIVNVIKDLI